jgi:hypothetical protein
LCGTESGDVLLQPNNFPLQEKAAKVGGRAAPGWQPPDGRLGLEVAPDCATGHGTANAANHGAARARHGIAHNRAADAANHGTAYGAFACGAAGANEGGSENGKNGETFGHGIFLFVAGT